MTVDGSFTIKLRLVNHRHSLLILSPRLAAPRPSPRHLVGRAPRAAAAPSAASLGRKLRSTERPISCPRSPVVSCVATSVRFDRSIDAPPRFAVRFAPRRHVSGACGSTPVLSRPMKSAPRRASQPRAQRTRLAFHSRAYFEGHGTTTTRVRSALASRVCHMWRRAVERARSLRRLTRAHRTYIRYREMDATHARNAERRRTVGHASKSAPTARRCARGTARVSYRRGASRLARASSEPSAAVRATPYPST